MFYDEKWFQRQVEVREALGLLVAEHGAPNRFHRREVADRTGLSTDVVARVGRHGGDIDVAGARATYDRGWFILVAREG